PTVQEPAAGGPGDAPHAAVDRLVAGQGLPDEAQLGHRLLDVPAGLLEGAYELVGIGLGTGAGPARGGGEPHVQPSGRPLPVRGNTRRTPATPFQGGEL